MAITFETERQQQRASLIGGAALAIIAVVAVLLYSSFHIVPPGNRGVAVRLGKVDQNQRPEGLTFKVPFADTIINYPVMQLAARGKAQCYSSDLQNITVSFTVMYRVPENKVVTLFQQYRGDPYVNLIEPRVQEIAKQVTAVSRAEDLVKNREKMKDSIVQGVRAVVGDVLNVVDISITELELSDQLEQAIEQKVVREQEAFAKQFELDKERKQAEITFVRAEAEAKSVQVKGAALKMSPEVIQFEIAQRWDGKTPQSVVISSGGANVLLPLR